MSGVSGLFAVSFFNLLNKINTVTHGVCESLCWHCEHFCIGEGGEAEQLKHPTVQPDVQVYVFICQPLTNEGECGLLESVKSKEARWYINPFPPGQG